MDMNSKNEILLIQLVLMFQTAAMQQMGKIKNPQSDQIERNLEQAQMSIDILDMLHEKMKGNLSPDEEKLMSTVLQELKLNFVDEKARDEKAMKEKSKEEAAPPPAPQASQTTEMPTP